MASLPKNPRRKILGPDVDGRAGGDEHPHLHHVRITQGDAAVCPIVLGVMIRRPFRLVRQSVDHDRTAGRDSRLACTRNIRFVGIRDGKREKKIAAGIAGVQSIAPLWSAKVALLLFVSVGVEPEGDTVGAQQLTAPPQL